MEMAECRGNRSAAFDVPEVQSLAPCEILGAGVPGEAGIGVLARKGLEAHDRGDYAGFEQLQSLYWERMTAALERRRVLGGGREDAGR